MEMKKCNAIFMLAAWLSASVSLCAAPRTEGQARLVAATFLNGRMATAKRAAAPALTLAATSADLETTAKRAAGSGEPAWYAYNQGTEAFVIVSGDDRMKDILGYSAEGPFEVQGMPSNLHAWLDAYAAQAAGLDLEDAAVPATAGHIRAEGLPEAVAPLLGDIAYNQYAPYNQLCPTIGGRRTLTGCLATSLASILSYWKYPAQGTGSYSYVTLSYGLACSFDFGAEVFDWDNILPRYTPGGYTDGQADAIARLMLACGVASEMDYTTYSSNAYTDVTMTGAARYLGMNPYALYRFRYFYRTQEWMDMLLGELAAGRPVLYGGNSATGSGHAFVVDGYDQDGMVHVNWGWGGSSNGYYEVASLDPYGNGNQGFAFMQDMVTGLAPKTILSTPTSLFLAILPEYEGDRCRVSSLLNYGNDFEGRLAIVAERDGVQVPVSSFLYGKMKSMTGADNAVFDMKEGIGQLEAGAYDVYVASQADGQADWTPACGTEVENPPCRLEVREDGTFAWTTVGRELPKAGIRLDGALYAGKGFTARIDLHNPAGEAFDGEIYLDIINPRTGYAFSHIYCGMAALEAGSDTTMTVADEMPDVEGAYLLRVSWGYSVYQFEPLSENMEVDILDPAGVGTVEAGARGADRPVYCSAQGESDIRFRYAGEVESVSLHNLAGQALATARVRRAADGTYVVPGTGLGRGCYILRIRKPGGETLSLKFNR